MSKGKTPEEVFNELSKQGAYEEAHRDKNEIQKVLTMALEDYTFSKGLRVMNNPSWRIIFTAHYDIIRELCEQLIRFNNIKISNHQGLFAYIILNFKELSFDWTFLESIRTTRNKNKYQGLNISKEMWKRSELQIDLYISALRSEITKRLEN